LSRLPKSSMLNWMNRVQHRQACSVNRPPAAGIGSRRRRSPEPDTSPSTATGKSASSISSTSEYRVCPAKGSSPDAGPSRTDRYGCRAGTPRRLRSTRPAQPRTDRRLARPWPRAVLTLDGRLALQSQMPAAHAVVPSEPDTVGQLLDSIAKTVNLELVHRLRMGPCTSCAASGWQPFITNTVPRSPRNGSISEMPGRTSSRAMGESR
jgi:hypothetical protein